MGPLAHVAEAAGRLERELGKAIVGQQRVIREILIAFLAGGHCLLRGYERVTRIEGISPDLSRFSTGSVQTMVYDAAG